MNLLIVNDEILTAETMKEDIIWEDYEIVQVFTAYDAEQAKQIILEKKVDIILCDIEMPGENGIELLRWVRQKNLEIECIFLTCHANFIYAKEAISLSCQDYILPPARNEDIGSAIAKVVERIYRKRDDIRFQKLGKEFVRERIKNSDEKFGDKRRPDEAIKEVSDYIREHIDDQGLSVNVIAEKFYFHPVYLNRLFRKEMDVSVGQFIINCRMDIAVPLLIDSNLSIKEIAEQVGYKNYSNFHSIFRKKYGCSPLQFKEQSKGGGK